MSPLIVFSLISVLLLTFYIREGEAGADSCRAFGRNDDYLAGALCGLGCGGSLQCDRQRVL